MIRLLPSALLALGCLATGSAAQQADRRISLFANAQQTVQADTVSVPAFRPLRVAKWSTLALATAAGIYGFVENGRADDRFAELEKMCEAQRIECQRRLDSGAYENEAFESLFQTVRRHDRRAHRALVAGQIGVAASVVMFLLDLGNARPPDDIPWSPGTVRMVRGPGVVRLGIYLPPRPPRD